MTDRAPRNAAPAGTDVASTTDTVPVRETHRFDVVALERYMAEHVAGFRGPVSVSQFQGGQSNPTYRLTSPGGEYVLRRKPPGKLLPSAHAVEREYKVIKALYEVGFPVARPYVLCEDESVIGTAFYVMDCVEGRVLWDQALPGMAPAERGAIWDELNRVIARLHGVDYRAVGLEDFGKPGDYIARQVSRWSKQYRASELERIEEMRELVERKRRERIDREATELHGTRLASQSRSRAILAAEPVALRTRTVRTVEREGPRRDLRKRVAANAARIALREEPLLGVGLDDHEPVAELRGGRE